MKSKTRKIDMEAVYKKALKKKRKASLKKNPMKKLNKLGKKRPMRRKRLQTSDKEQKKIDDGTKMFEKVYLKPFKKGTGQLMDEKLKKNPKMKITRKRKTEGRIKEYNKTLGK